MTHNRAHGGATGSPGRRLRRVEPPPAPGAPRPLRPRSVAERQLIAGLFAVALAIGLGGTVLVLDAPPGDREAVTAAFRQAPLTATAAALAGDPLPLPSTLPAAPPAEAVGADGPDAIPDGTTAPVRSTGFSPRSLSIPSLDLTTGVLATGMTEDRNLEVPADAGDVGWYRGFAEPGDPGVSVLLGHVDSRSGPGVFFRLPELQPGERITVERSDGREVVYEVTDVSWYPKDDFPTLDVYTTDREQVLRLITCGGEFDASRRTYLENVVVSAVPVADTDGSAAVRPSHPGSSSAAV